jgi:hypothetical protein
MVGREAAGLLDEPPHHALAEGDATRELELPEWEFKLCWSWLADKKRARARATAPTAALASRL